MNDSITATLRALTSDMECLLADKLRPLGITVPQMEFLAVFTANPEYSGADAAKAAHVTPQTGSTVMQNLARKRLITVKQVRGGGHRNTITITKRGADILTRAQGAVADVEERLSALLGPEAKFRIADSISALKPYLPQRTWQPKPWPQRAKPSRAKAKGAQAKSGGDGANKLDRRCREWAASMSSDGTIPGHVAAQFGTQAHINQLVGTSRWKPDGNNYRIND